MCDDTGAACCGIREPGWKMAGMRFVAMLDSNTMQWVGYCPRCTGREVMGDFGGSVAQPVGHVCGPMSEAGMFELGESSGGMGWEEGS
jgi:hypothetical protein